MASSSAVFTHHFLIAMPAMVDPNFAHTLTFVCEHNDEGALGIVVNKPIDMTLSALFEQIDIAPRRRGAAASARAFRRAGAGRSRLRAAPAARQLAVDAGDQRRLGLTTSKDVLEALGRGEGPRDVLVSLGYAGWSAGQLEHEIAQNAWLTVAADPDVMFDAPADARLPAAMRLLGIDFSRLSEDVGHA